MTLDDAVRLRLEIEDLYADYAACLDEGELERWPDFFVESGVYRVVSRENYDQDLPLATMLCEGRGMLRDRVHSIRETSMFAPRYLRHLVSAVRVRSEGDELRANAKKDGRSQASSLIPLNTARRRALRFPGSTRSWIVFRKCPASWGAPSPR